MTRVGIGKYKKGAMPPERDTAPPARIFAGDQFEVSVLTWILESFEIEKSSVSVSSSPL
jgi:hypothetical protein